MQQLQASGHELVEYRIVKDDALEIRSALSAMMKSVQVILSSGGTGITGRDVTIPVVEGLLTKPMPGFGELFRMLSYKAGERGGHVVAGGGRPGPQHPDLCAAGQPATPRRPPGKGCCATNSHIWSSR